MTEPTPRLVPRIDSGQQEVVRWVALAAMAVDHVGAVLLPADSAQPLRFVGRVAWPLFAFLIAYNVAVRGVDPRRYLMPLLLWGLVAQVPHTLAFGYFRVSIMGTLFLAAAALVLLQRLGVRPARHGTGGQATAEPLAAGPPAPGAALLGLAGIALLSSAVEYGPYGVALVIAMWWAAGSGAPLAWLAASALTALVNYPYPNWPAALIALPVIALAGHSRLRLPRSGRLPWLFYPAHLLVLWLLSLLVR